MAYLKRLLRAVRFSVGPLRRPPCSLLNLLLEDEDALPLLWGQHGDLFRGQLQDLHNQGSLERDKEKGQNGRSRCTKGAGTLLTDRGDRLSGTHLLLVLCGDLALPGTESAS